MGGTQRRAEPVIYGIGVDLLHPQRLARMHDRHGGGLLRAVLSRRELQAHAQRKRGRLQRLAEALAVKEAFVKALGTGFVDISHRDCGLVSGKGGVPALAFSRALRTRLRALGITASRVSLGSTGEVVCATVILECRAAAPLGGAQHLMRRRAQGSTQ